MTNRPTAHIVSPHLSTEQREYMALTTPEDPMREDVARALYDLEYSTGMAPYEKLHGYFLQNADAAIAAAEPHMRARHRAELFSELIAMYEGDAEGFGDRARGMSVGLFALIGGLKRLAEQDAIATAGRSGDWET